MSRTFAVVGSLNRNTPYFEPAHGTEIVVLDFDPGSGTMARRHDYAGIDNPSYIAVNAKLSTVYATSEVFGWNEGTVTAFRVDRTTGSPTYINKQPALGDITTHVSLDCNERFAIATNYSMLDTTELPGRSVVVLPILADGRLGAPRGSCTHSGHGMVPGRQDRSHPHCSRTSPNNKFVVMADLGTDEILLYRFDATTGEIDARPHSRATLPSGCGPRHIVFHPSGGFAYLINELGSTFTALRFDANEAEFRIILHVPTLPSNVPKANNLAAHIEVAPDGRFLYGSNRGHDSIAVCKIDQQTGELSIVDHTAMPGRTPRHFTIDAAGRFLIVAIQDGDVLASFRIDEHDGRLIDTGGRVEAGSPMCVKLLTV